MQHYAIEDFLTYYKGSYILHPVTDHILSVQGKQDDKVQVYNLSSKETEFLDLKDLDWKHVATPTLGYRGFNNGQRLYYLTRHAGRRTQKGVTPSAISIHVPEIISQLSFELRHGDGAINDASLENNDLVRALYSPQFTPLNAAVEALQNEQLALGFALSRNWAVSLGMYKDSLYLLHFKNLRVGGSQDGRQWKFSAPAAEKLWANSQLGA